MLTFSLSLNFTKISPYLSVLYALALLIQPALNLNRNSLIVPRLSSLLIVSIIFAARNVRVVKTMLQRMLKFTLILLHGATLKLDTC